ncbi:RNA 2',3'-cyclic phosphodiesterase [Ornithinimicrobium pratense]|uniref:RNA 2',3'-cyclic phosphodiesterase n=1 Tax=Ornithinimicrobium pratense TaxID=2593973 RepID=A0A5J6V7K3_9MICO|nr:RNA 2',3'-cyclic phosphodiesterase [Ornithinimicrobium pratense]QFG69829.1 RNA 2',3'-cyclic phosphodiesterase [Ornithinimicrobium pratense]
MRAFVALLPPPEVIDQLTSFLEPRRDALAALDTHPRWRWTRPEHLHLTLAFLPELDEWREEELEEEGMRWAARVAPLTLRLAGAGAFPDPGAARVLWAAVREEPEVEEPRLGSWASATRALASRVGARVDGTRFSPHVTVARAAGRPGLAGHLLQSLDTLHTDPWIAEEVCLIRSYLGQGPRGTPRYEVLQTWPVGD